MALFALIGSSAMAQEVTLDFTVVDPSDETGKTSYWGFPSGSDNKLTEEKSFTYDGYTVKVAAPDGYYWHNKDHYLLFGKMGATLTLPAFDFDVERIDIEGNGNASAGTKQNIFVGDEAVSTETTGAQGTNYFQIAEGKQAAGTIYVIKVTSKHNNQIRTIKIWKKGAGTKQAAEISWSSPSATVTIGADDNIFPTLTNPNNLTVSYTSSKEEVATVDASGHVTLVAAGSTKISAVFEGNDSYEASTVSYNLTVKEVTQETEKTIAELYDLTAATANIKLKISNGKVVYVNGTSAYVRDGAKAMYFYNTGLDLPLNATVSGTVNVDLDIYKGLHEVKKNSNTNADNLVITASSEEAVPVEATFANLAANNYTNDLIIIKDQSVIEDGGKWYIQSGDTKVQLYKKDADYSQYVSETKKYDITAIATVYNSNAQLTPISFSETTNIQNMTIDTDVSAPIYSLDGRRVDQNYRGVVIQNGVKRIQK